MEKPDPSRIGQAEKDKLGGNVHGLVMAVKNATTFQSWGLFGTDEDLAKCETKARNYSDISGYGNCEHIRANRGNFDRYPAFKAADGYNTTLLSRELEPQLAALDLPDGVTAELAGETTQVTEMLSQMAKMLALALAFVYFVMVAQFQSLLSPFIVLFTIPLAFTGGMLGLMAAGEQMSLISLMGFLVLMGVVVNNGIVFVDYANQLRIGGLERTDALVATGRTRMRPILMTTLTTVLAMVTMLFGTDMASEMSTGMAIVIIGGLSYATLMTLFVVPVLYDLFYRRPPVNIDVGDDGLDDLPDDAAEFAAEFAARRAAEAASAPRRPDLSRAARAPEENDGEKKEADHDNG